MARRQDNRGRRGGFEQKDEFEQQTVDLARVTRVTKGGKQMSFRACIVVGDRKGRVGEGTGKGRDVQIAMEKAVRLAKKHVVRVQLVGGTIPHRTESKYKATSVMIKPAPPGSGLICGGAVRVVLNLAGVETASAKIFGGKNKITTVRATIDALKKLRTPRVVNSASRRTVVESVVQPAAPQAA